MLAPPVHTNPVNSPGSRERGAGGPDGRGTHREEGCGQRAPLESSPRLYLRVTDDMGEDHFIKLCGASDSLHLYPGAPNPKRPRRCPITFRSCRRAERSEACSLELAKRAEAATLLL